MAEPSTTTTSIVSHPHGINGLPKGPGPTIRLPRSQFDMASMPMVEVFCPGFVPEPGQQTIIETPEEAARLARLEAARQERIAREEEEERQRWSDAEVLRDEDVAAMVGKTISEAIYEKRESGGAHVERLVLVMTDGDRFIIRGFTDPRLDSDLIEVSTEERTDGSA